MPSYSVILTTTLLLLTGEALAAGCYNKKGHQQQYDDTVKTGIKQFCNNHAGKEYGSGAADNGCYNVGGGNRINMQIKNTGDDSGFITVHDCVVQQTKTGKGCHGYGGIKHFLSFDLQYDPNSGNC